MNLKDFKKNSNSARAAIAISEMNPSYVTELLASHLNKTPEELLKLIDINIRFVPQTVELVKRKDTSFDEFTRIFYYLQEREIVFQSIAQDSLRFDLRDFFNKIT